jgi:hypothetical protein
VCSLHLLITDNIAIRPTELRAVDELCMVIVYFVSVACHIAVNYVNMYRTVAVGEFLCAVILSSDLYRTLPF